MKDILDHILAMPGRNHRLTPDQQKACRAFVVALGADRDFDDSVAVLAGIALMFNARRGLAASSTMRRIEMIARAVEREWQGR